MYFNSIFKSLLKNKWRSIGCIVQLAFGSIIITIALASYRNIVKINENARKVVLPNVYRTTIIDRLDLQGVSLMNKDKDIDLRKRDSERFRLAYSMLKGEPRVADIGIEAYFDGRALSEAERKDSEMIKCSNEGFDIFEYEKEVTGMFNFRVRKGMTFSEYFADNTIDKNVIPILVTEALAKENTLGSIVKIPRCGNFSFKIIGVLDGNYPMLFNMLFSGGSPGNLDSQYAVVTGGMINENYAAAYIKLKEGVDKDAFKRELDSKLDHSEEMQFESVSKMAEQVLVDLPQTEVFAYYGTIILILSSFGIISTVMSSLLKRKREFGVRIAVGADKKHIEKLVVGEVLFLFIASQIVSFIAVYIIHRKYEGLVFDLFVLGTSFGILLLLTTMAIIPAFIRVFRMEAVELIHERR